MGACNECFNDIVSGHKPTCSKALKLGELAFGASEADDIRMCTSTSAARDMCNRILAEKLGPAVLEKKELEEKLRVATQALEFAFYWYNTNMKEPVAKHSGHPVAMKAREALKSIGGPNEEIWKKGGAE